MNKLLKKWQEKQGIKRDPNLVTFESGKKVIKFGEGAYTNQDKGGECPSGVNWAVGVAEDIVINGLGGYSAIVGSDKVGEEDPGIGSEGEHGFDWESMPYEKWANELQPLEDKLVRQNLSCAQIYSQLDEKAVALGKAELARLQNRKGSMRGKAKAM